MFNINEVKKKKNLPDCKFYYRAETREEEMSWYTLRWFQIWFVKTFVLYKIITRKGSHWLT